MPNLEYKRAQVETTPEVGVLKGLLASADTWDDQNDSFAPGAWSDFLSRNAGKDIPCLKSHSQSEFPLGVFDGDSLVEDKDGLRGTCRLAIYENPDAATAYNLLKAGKLYGGLSVGFRMVRGEPARMPNGSAGRRILAADLFECSLVSFLPSNRNATVETLDGKPVESVYKASVMNAVRQGVAEAEAEHYARQLVELLRRAK